VRAFDQSTPVFLKSYFLNINNLLMVYVFFRKLLTYAPYSEQPSLHRTREDLNEVTMQWYSSFWKPALQWTMVPLKNRFLFQSEQVIFDAFSNTEFVDKLITYLSLEDRKGKDKFNVHRFVLFKVMYLAHTKEIVREMRFWKLWKIWVWVHFAFLFCRVCFVILVTYF
jgi:hypothetical protein